MAMAQGGSYSSDSTPSLETSICHGCGPKKTKNIHILNNLKVELCFFGFWGFGGFFAVVFVRFLFFVFFFFFFFGFFGWAFSVLKVPG